MSKTAVWAVSIATAVAVFAVVLVVGYRITDNDPPWLIPLAAAAFAACIAIGNTVVSLRFKPAPSSPDTSAAAAPTTQAPNNPAPTRPAPTHEAPPSQQTGTTFATGGSIAGINAGGDVTIGMPAQDSTATPKPPGEGA
ncbi:hypothetical protein [Kribbella sp. NBC_00889]|uniref:hypothetical protein n=1 Tax=Kribbella sp. NBC_00889 TaxID=2975974 RepID=UPI0038646B47|nr:hypothetical protein OG817_10960 [Kribbella sp. NBC_00889]